MAFLTRKKTVDVADMRKFTESILTEFGVAYKKAGLKDESFGLQKGYKI
jgi:hypothetical protein